MKPLEPLETNTAASLAAPSGVGIPIESFPVEVRQALSSIDEQGNGIIEPIELVGMIQQHKRLTDGAKHNALDLSGLPPDVQEACKAFDADGSGNVQMSELANAARMYQASRQREGKLVKTVVALVLLLVLLVGSIVGLTALVFEMNKELKGSTDGVLKVKGSDETVKVKSEETYVSSSGEVVRRGGGGQEVTMPAKKIDVALKYSTPIELLARMEKVRVSEPTFKSIATVTGVARTADEVTINTELFKIRLFKGLSNIIVEPLEEDLMRATELLPVVEAIGNTNGTAALRKLLQSQRRLLTASKAIVGRVSDEVPPGEDPAEGDSGLAIMKIRRFGRCTNFKSLATVSTGGDGGVQYRHPATVEDCARLVMDGIKAGTCAAEPPLFGFTLNEEGKASVPVLDYYEYVKMGEQDFALAPGGCYCVPKGQECEPATTRRWGKLKVCMKTWELTYEGDECRADVAPVRPTSPFWSMDQVIQCDNGCWVTGAMSDDPVHQANACTAPIECKRICLSGDASGNGLWGCSEIGDICTQKIQETQTFKEGEPECQEISGWVDANGNSAATYDTIYLLEAPGLEGAEEEKDFGPLVDATETTPIPADPDIQLVSTGQLCTNLKALAYAPPLEYDNPLYDTYFDKATDRSDNLSTDALAQGTTLRAEFMTVDECMERARADPDCIAHGPTIQFHDYGLHKPFAPSLNARWLGAGPAGKEPLKEWHCSCSFSCSYDTYHYDDSRRQHLIEPGAPSCNGKIFGIDMPGVVDIPGSPDDGTYEDFPEIRNPNGDISLAKIYGPEYFIEAQPKQALPFYSVWRQGSRWQGNKRYGRYMKPTQGSCALPEFRYNMTDEDLQYNKDRGLGNTNVYTYTGDPEAAYTGLGLDSATGPLCMVLKFGRSNLEGNRVKRVDYPGLPYKCPGYVNSENGSVPRGVPGFNVETVTETIVTDDGQPKIISYAMAFASNGVHEWDSDFSTVCCRNSLFADKPEYVGTETNRQEYQFMLDQANRDPPPRPAAIIVSVGVNDNPDDYVEMKSGKGYGMTAHGYLYTRYESTPMFMLPDITTEYHPYSHYKCPKFLSNDMLIGEYDFLDNSPIRLVVEHYWGEEDDPTKPPRRIRVRNFSCDGSWRNVFVKFKCFSDANEGKNMDMVHYPVFQPDCYNMDINKNPYKESLANPTWMVTGNHMRAWKYGMKCPEIVTSENWAVAAADNTTANSKHTFRLHQTERNQFSDLEGLNKFEVVNFWIERTDWVGRTETSEGFQPTGWDYNLVVPCCMDPTYCIEVSAGMSTEYEKEVVIPTGYTCPGSVNRDTWSVNDHHARVGDTFHVSQLVKGADNDNDKLIVTRSDAPGAGWGIDLKFKCCAQHDSVRINVGTNVDGWRWDEKVWKVPRGYVCPKIVTKENWLGGWQYNDIYDIFQDTDDSLPINGCGFDTYRGISAHCEDTIRVQRRSCGTTNEPPSWGLNLEFDCHRVPETYPEYMQERGYPLAKHVFKDSHEVRFPPLCFSEECWPYGVPDQYFRDPPICDSNDLCCFIGESTCRRNGTQPVN